MSRHIPKAVRNAVKERDGNQCRQCGRRTIDVQVDHITPVKHGGLSTYENLQMLCPKCNNEKRDRTDRCDHCNFRVAHDASRCPNCKRSLIDAKIERYKESRPRMIENKALRVILWLVVAFCGLMLLLPLLRRGR